MVLRSICKSCTSNFDVLAETQILSLVLHASGVDVQSLLLVVGLDAAAEKKIKRL
jgi:hypothetical protein